MPRRWSPSRGLSRRQAMTAVAAVVGASVAGCTEGGVSTPGGRAPSTGSNGVAADPSASASAAADPDLPVALAVLRAEQDMLAALSITSERHPSLGRSLAPLLHSHRAHVALLRDATSSLPAPKTPGQAGSGLRAPRDPARARAALAAREGELTGLLTAHALAARGGPFARVLASMAAAAAQHSVMLSPAGERRIGPPW